MKDKLTDKLANIGEDTSSGSYGGKQVDGKADFGDYEQLLICLGQIYTYIKVTQENIDEDGTPEEKMVKGEIDDVESQATKMIGAYKVPGTASDNGLDWDTDILRNLDR